MRKKEVEEYIKSLVGRVAALEENQDTLIKAVNKTATETGDVKKAIEQRNRYMANLLNYNGNEQKGVK